MNINFAGIPEEFTKKETSKVVIVPLEHQNNTNQTGLSTIFTQSSLQELYDIETDSEPYLHGIHITEKQHIEAPEQLSEQAYNDVKKYILTNKFPIILSDAPLVSIGAIKAFNEHFENLSVLHIDAKARLYKQVNDEKVHNQCAMYHASQTTNLIQVGIRDIAKIETTVLNTEKTFFANEMISDDYWIENATESLTNDVVIVLNLEGLDPSIAPGVDNPIHGGLLWYETLEFLKTIFTDKNVVGINIVGISTHTSDQITHALVSRLIYKIIAYKFNLNKSSDFLE